MKVRVSFARKRNSNERNKWRIREREREIKKELQKEN
jgi:hypothetical protein